MLRSFEYEQDVVWFNPKEIRFVIFTRPLPKVEGLARLPSDDVAHLTVYFNGLEHPLVYTGDRAWVFYDAIQNANRVI